MTSNIDRENETPIPGPTNRPVGNMEVFLEDIAARGFVPKHILDVGANHALWSRLAKKVFKEASFTLIEPVIELKSSLDKFCSDYPDTTLLNVGVGTSNRTETITIWPDLAGNSILMTETEAQKHNMERRKISIATIDSLMENSHKPLPDLAKLDIQGYELEALCGATTLFGVTEVFILEVSLMDFLPGQPSFLDVLNFMNERGYVVYDFCGFLRRPYDGALAQTDIAFVQRNGFFWKSNRWK